MNENDVDLKKNGKVYEFPFGVRFAYVDITPEGWYGDFPEYGGLKYSLDFRNSHCMKSDIVATVCFNVEDDVIGYSVTSRYDQFAKKPGRNKAYGRYVQAKKHDVHINGPDVVNNYMIVGLSDRIHDFVKTNLR